MTKIGIQGGEASYHEMAAHQLHKDSELVYYDTFSDVFTALHRKRVESAIVALANNSIGFISEPYAEIMDNPEEYRITGETYLRVEHALMAPAGATLDTIEEVHSQSPALEQCRRFLEYVLSDARLVEEHDTAGSAHLLADLNDPSKAAIASVKAADLYGLTIIKERVQDDQANITRFVEIKPSNHPEVISDADKTTIILKTKEYPGALADALQPFKEAGINLANLHSRIIPSSAFEMVFFIEFEAGLQEDNARRVIWQLDRQGQEVEVLGSYKSAAIPLDKV